MTDFETRILAAIAKEGGEITVPALESLYTNRRADAVRVSWLIRHGLIEWIRNIRGSAISVRLTEDGRLLHKSRHTSAHSGNE